LKGEAEILHQEDLSLPKQRTVILECSAERSGFACPALMRLQAAASFPIVAYFSSLLHPRERFPASSLTI
jgi:hypothetical protein